MGVTEGVDPVGAENSIGTLTRTFCTCVRALSHLRYDRILDQHRPTRPTDLFGTSSLVAALDEAFGTHRCDRGRIDSLRRSAHGYRRSRQSGNRIHRWRSMNYAVVSPSANAARPTGRTSWRTDPTASRRTRGWRPVPSPSLACAWRSNRRTPSRSPGWWRRATPACLPPWPG